jgi:hypothetical protein
MEIKEASEGQPQPEKNGNAFTNWLRSHPVWGIVIASVLGLAIGAGAASDTSELDDANEKVASLEKQLDRETASRETAEEEINNLEANEEQVAARSARLDTKAAKLDRREKEVTSAENRKAKNSIDDGIWQVGVDFESGIYRSEGGTGCYWALLGSADTEDIVNNGGFTANQTLTIDSPWFETSGCGTWEKIG